MPFSTALPESGSKRSPLASTLLFAPASRAATLHPRALGRRGPSRAGCSRRRARTASVTSTGTIDLAGRRAHAHRRAVGDAEPRPRRRGGRAACSAPCPSRARAGCASTSCSTADRAGRRARASGRVARSSDRAQPRDVVDASTSGASSILPRRRAQHLGDARLQRAEVDAVRVRLEHREATGRRGRRRSRRRTGRCAA